MSSIENENSGQITGATLIFLMLGIIIIFILGMMYFEKYLKNKDEKMVLYTFAVLICLNIIIFMFLYFTFSKIRFRRGPRGPKGMRGRAGLSGRYDTINLCNKQSNTLGEEKYEIQKRTNLRVQKPVLGD